MMQNLSFMTAFFYFRFYTALTASATWLGPKP